MRRHRFARLGTMYIRRLSTSLRRPLSTYAIAEIESEIGAIDILVNNAGIQRRGALEEFPVETWRELMSTNLDGVFYAAKAVSQHMEKRGSRSIINICSVQSELGRPTIAPYTASKGAVKC